MVAAHANTIVITRASTFTTTTTTLTTTTITIFCCVLLVYEYCYLEKWRSMGWLLAVKHDELILPGNCCSSSPFNLVEKICLPYIIYYV